MNIRRLRKALLAIFSIIFIASCQPTTVVPSFASSSDSSANCRAGDYIEELTSGGRNRAYRLHIPSTYRPEKPAALILGFHGAGSNSAQFESYSGFSALADRAGFIVVYPQALGEHRTWNTTTGTTNPDLQFASELIETLEGRCHIDPRRIYASGHSNGGGMANRLACDLSDRIAAIGSVSGAYQWSEDCLPSQPVAILAIHGTADPIIPYNGFEGTGAPPAAYYLIGTPIPQWAASWARRNDCDNKPAVLAQNNAQVTEESWSNCRAKADVILYTIRGGGHGWTDAFDAAQLIWGFFVQHPLVERLVKSRRLRQFYIIK